MINRTLRYLERCLIMIAFFVYSHEIHVSKDSLIQLFFRKDIRKHFLGNIFSIQLISSFIYTDMYYIVVIYIIHADSFFRISSFNDFHLRRVDIDIASITGSFIYYHAIFFYYFLNGRSDFCFLTGKCQRISRIVRFVQFYNLIGETMEPETILRLPVYLISRGCISTYIYRITYNLEVDRQILRVDIINSITVNTH